MLSGCTDKKPRCTVESSCVSGLDFNRLYCFHYIHAKYVYLGRKDCKDGKYCSKLTQKPGKDIAWRCQSGINPYKEDIPKDTPCYA